MRVLIAGVAGPTGRLLAERLLAEPDPVTVIGLDQQACYPPIDGLRFVRAAPCQPEWTLLLREADAAIHLGGLRWPLPWSERHREADLIDESKFFVRAAVEAGVPRLMFLTSAALYGPQPPGPVTESAVIRGHEASTYARVRAQVADYLATVRYTGVLTQLRAAWLCGPHHLALVRLVASGPVRACGYEDRTLAVLHEEDLVAAVRLALRDNLAGIYNVSSGAGITLRELAALAGSDSTCVPLAWLVVRAWWHWRWLRRRTPPLWMKGLIDSRPLDAGKLHATGWSPRYTSRETFVEALEIYRAT